ncbi:hypothetical protein B566_EDAN009095, partial [Ephemera danica]
VAEIAIGTKGEKLFDDYRILGILYYLKSVENKKCVICKKGSASIKCSYHLTCKNFMHLPCAHGEKSKPLCPIHAQETNDWSSMAQYYRFLRSQNELLANGVETANEETNETIAQSMNETDKFTYSDIRPVLPEQSTDALQSSTGHISNTPSCYTSNTNENPETVREQVKSEDCTAKSSQTRESASPDAAKSRPPQSLNLQEGMTSSSIQNIRPSKSYRPRKKYTDSSDSSGKNNCNYMLFFCVKYHIKFIMNGVTLEII